MKTAIMITCMIVLHSLAMGQQGNIVTTNAAPVPYQFTNYAQNNASYVNNSMQNNRPADIHSGPYTGNADYADPTRSFNIPYIYSAPANTNITPVVSPYANAGAPPVNAPVPVQGADNRR